MNPQIRTAIENEAKALEEIIDNAQAVHGTPFVDFLKFLQRGAAVVRLTALLPAAPPDARNELGKIVCDIMGQQAAAYAIAAGLSPEEAQEARQMSQMLMARTVHLEKSIRGLC